ncbi:Tn3 family transposase [Streptomyces sp. YH02]|uniref:Tn3 family transposase n=1 Tax=Streptomyces sp. YH02 TaxID=3256999 RepID=UPI0037569863
MAYTANRHFSLVLLNEAIADLVNAHACLDISQAWGERTMVAAEGTHMDTYLDNLLRRDEREARQAGRDRLPPGLGYRAPRPSHGGGTVDALLTEDEAEDHRGSLKPAPCRGRSSSPPTPYPAPGITGFPREGIPGRVVRIMKARSARIVRRSPL